jgi:hypothetical protein
MISEREKGLESGLIDSDSDEEVTFKQQENDKRKQLHDLESSRDTKCHPRSEQ